MNNKLEIFRNNNFGEIRTLLINDEVWFVGKDIAEALGYKNTRDALLKHIDEEDKTDVAIHDGSQNRNMIIINESGLYSLVLSSKLPQAKDFKRWVTNEVLPTLRKTGTYTMQQPTQQTTVSLKEQVEVTNFIANSLNVNEASKIVMFRKVYEDNNVPCSFLPDYIQGDNKELRSATELLEKFNLGMNIRKFNSLLVEKGYLEEKSRASKNRKSGIKKYKILTEKGLQFGENMISPHNQKEAQPQYYVDRFLELFKLVV